MPQVPTYDTRQVAPGGQLPGFESVDIRQQGQLVRNAENQGLQQASSNIMGVLGEMQQRRNVELVTKAEAQLVELDNEFRRGASEKLGENAHGITQEAEKFWGEIPRKLGEDFENDQQRRVFDAVVQRRRAASMDAVASHEAKQSRVATLQTSEASGNAHLSSIAGIAASGTWDDVNRAAVRTELEDGLAAIEVGSKAAGLPEAARAAARLAYTTKAHAEVIQGLADRDPEAATEYFNTHRDQIDGSAHAKLQRVLEIGGMEVEGQNAVAHVRQQGMSQADAIKYVEENYSGKREEYIKRAVFAEFTQREQMQKDAVAKALDPVYTLAGDALTAGRYISKEEQAAVLKPLRLMDPEIYDKAVQKLYQHNERIRVDRQQAEDRARANAERYGRGAGGEAQVATWYQLKTDPDALRAVDLLQLRTAGYLTDSQFKNLAEEQQALRSKGAGKDKEDTILSDKAAVDLVLRGAGLKTDGKDADHALLGKFYEKFDARVRQAGKALTQQDKVNIARELVKERVIKQPFYRPDSTAFEFEVDAPPAFQPRTSVTGEQRATGRISRDGGMPQATRNEIIRALKEAGRPVNERNIQELYQRGLAQ